jgi:hypothetical protein
VKAFRLLLALVFLLPVHALRAEIEERALMSVNIPFAFTVENTRLPAGHYVIYAVHLDHLWRLSSFRHGGTAYFSVTTDQAQARPGRARLIFNRYDTEYVLHQIDDNAGRTKATLYVRKRERQLASGTAHPEMAMVYAEHGAENGAENGAQAGARHE